MTTWLDNLADATWREHSQNGEEGIIDAIFRGIGETNRYLVDIGAGDGEHLSNTLSLLECGWRGVRFDVNPEQDVLPLRVTAENICQELAAHDVPREFDFLSLDIDGVDWYVLRSVLREYQPRAFVCEFNHSKPCDPPTAVKYDPALAFKYSDYYSASLGAYIMLAESRGYALVHCLAYNAFFVRRELLPQDFVSKVAWVQGLGWPPDPEQRPWVLITKDDLP
jgi:hypothetical protein